MSETCMTVRSLTCTITKDNLLPIQLCYLYLKYNIHVLHWYYFYISLSLFFFFTLNRTLYITSFADFLAHSLGIVPPFLMQFISSNIGIAFPLPGTCISSFTLLSLSCVYLLGLKSQICFKMFTLNIINNIYTMPRVLFLISCPGIFFFNIPNTYFMLLFSFCLATFAYFRMMFYSSWWNQTYNTEWL